MSTRRKSADAQQKKVLQQLVKNPLREEYRNITLHLWYLSTFLNSTDPMSIQMYTKGQEIRPGIIYIPKRIDIPRYFSLDEVLKNVCLVLYKAKAEQSVWQALQKYDGSCDDHNDNIRDMLLQLLSEMGIDTTKLCETFSERIAALEQSDIQQTRKNEYIILKERVIKFYDYFCKDDNIQSRKRPASISLRGSFGGDTAQGGSIRPRRGSFGGQVVQERQPINRQGIIQKFRGCVMENLPSLQYYTYITDETPLLSTVKVIRDLIEAATYTTSVPQRKIKLSTKIPHDLIDQDRLAIIQMLRNGGKQILAKDIQTYWPESQDMLRRRDAILRKLGRPERRQYVIGQFTKTIQYLEKNKPLNWEHNVKIMKHIIEPFVGKQVQTPRGFFQKWLGYVP